MFKSLGEIITDVPKGSGRTGEPVRRHSHMAGRCEGPFWRRMDRQDARKIVLAAKRYELAGRQAGERNGPLGGVALEIIDLLANLMHGKTGRLEPSLEWLMQTLKRSKDAIVRGLKALRTHGFLDWLRRYVPTGNEGRGPRVQQTSNAYRLSMPPRALRLLGRAGGAVPLPDDHSHRTAAAEAERAAQEATLTPTERTRLIVDDDGSTFAATMLRFAASFEADQRESAKRSESGTRFKS